MSLFLLCFLLFFLIQGMIVWMITSLLIKMGMVIGYLPEMCHGGIFLPPKLLIIYTVVYISCHFGFKLITRQLNTTITSVLKSIYLNKIYNLN